MSKVKLVGSWVSVYIYRVIWALKLKGVAFEYFEEDLSNRSPLLLYSNPVHKKIPILIHGEKPIYESMIILEYLEDVWPYYPLLPNDPYDKATARFWIKFAEDKQIPTTVWLIYRTRGKEQKKAVKESLEMLQTIEEHALGDENKFFGGDKINMVDIAVCGIAYWLGIIDDVAGMKLVEPHIFPCLNQWIENFKQVPVIKENPFIVIQHLLT
ncbi:hypothetical protein CRYUN_Cryun21dG0093600 [Craigia yunnanensis]